jgi:pimeloyl-ACP methyl ester carboxylesterase
MPTPPAAPGLVWVAAPPDPAGVVLVLHGGQVSSSHPVGRTDLAPARMIPIARRIASAGQGRLAVVRVRNRVRGWNGSSADPLADARHALGIVRDRWGGIPVGVVGHSMGGRVALRLAEDPGVALVVGLAPWIDRSDAPLGRPGLPVLLMHGRADVVTSPRATRRYAESLLARGVRVQLDLVALSLHAMTPWSGYWHERVATFVAEGLRAPD